MASVTTQSQQPRKVRGRSSQTDLLRIAMIEMHLSFAELARRVGFTERAFKDAYYASFPRDSLRWAVEGKALLYQRAIWTGFADLQLRKACFEIHGVDPFLVRRPELNAFAEKIGINVRGRMSLPEARRKVMDALRPKRGIER